MNTKKYNATFILDTRGYTDPVENLIEKITKVIESAGCKMEGVENLGQKQFVRTADKKFPSGIYVTFKYEGPVSANDQIREKLRLDRTVNRILVLAQ